VEKFIGDAVVLLTAARAAGRANWQAEAIATGFAAAERPRRQTGVVDGSLCHGAGGLAHIFARLHHATGEEAFADAARHWYGEPLAMHRPGEGLGSFGTDDSTPGGHEEPADPGFLTGAAGIGLALLAGAAVPAPAWDRLLLLSTPQLAPA
jgi:hypothetical protein